jgi:hypothetical protein
MVDGSRSRDFEIEWFYRWVASRAELLSLPELYFV